MHQSLFSIYRKSSLSRVHFYRYLQIRSYLNSIPYYKSGRKLNILDSLITKAATINKKVMTYIYIYDQLLMNDETTINIKNSWERDLGIHLDDQTWCKLCIMPKELLDQTNCMKHNFR